MTAILIASNFLQKLSINSSFRQSYQQSKSMTKADFILQYPKDIHFKINYKRRDVSSNGLSTVR